MKKLFGLFVIGILSSTAMAELVCLSPSGCAIEIETGACPTCVETSIVEPIVESIVKSEIFNTSPSSCPNYHEIRFGGKVCERMMNICLESKDKADHWYCKLEFQSCKESENHHNETTERNRGKIICG